MEPKKENWFASAWRPLNRFQKGFVVFLVIAFLFVFYVALDANKYEATVRVIEGEGKVGINPTTERLDFGDLSRGTSSVRRVTIANGTFMPMYVLIWETGDIADLMELDKNSIRLAKGEEARIEFTTYMPASAQVDRIYDGRVFVFKIPTFGL